MLWFHPADQQGMHTTPSVFERSAKRNTIFWNMEIPLHFFPFGN